MKGGIYERVGERDERGDVESRGKGHTTGVLGYVHAWKDMVGARPFLVGPPNDIMGPTLSLSSSTSALRLCLEEEKNRWKKNE